MAKADMFLSVKGAKHGVIRGESTDSAHKDQIEVVSWSWGMRSPDLGGEATGKRSFSELRIFKHVDRATPTLYSALASNETLSNVTLTVRKSGGDAKDYFTIGIEKARLTAIETHSGELDHPEALLEEVRFAFRKIDMTYKPQSGDGQLGGAVTYNDEIDAGK